MIIEIPVKSNSKIPQTVSGLAITINGKRVEVPFTDIESFEFDSDNIDEAETLYVNYRGNEYSLPLPAKDSMDWNDVLEIWQPA